MDLQQLNTILAYEFLGNDLRTYAIGLGVLLLIYILFRFVVGIFLLRLEKLAGKTKNHLDDAFVHMLEKNRWMFFLILSVVYVDLAFKLPAYVETSLDILTTVLIVLLVIRILNSFIDFFAETISKKKRQSAEQLSIQLIGKILKFLVWVFGGLFLISAFGYNISSLVAGLGIGGIAIALAVQNLLGDLISSLSIYLDKPFKVGDYIVIGTQMGTVKSIGLKTTRITSLQGEEVVMSNKKLTESDINNFGKMQKRRVLVNLGVTYNTKLKKMEKIPAGLRTIIESVKDTTFDRAFFKSYGDFSKNYEFVFYVESKDYQTYAGKLEEVNLKVQEFFEKEKIDFAYPTQTIYMKK